MLEPRLFVKEKQLKGTSSTFGNQLIPILYAEMGQIPKSKPGKTKKCLIISNMAGIYFFKTELLSASLSALNFISIFDIKEIRYVDAKKRIIVTKDGHESFFIADHADEAVAKLAASKMVLTENNSAEAIVLTGFPKEPTIEQTALGEVLVQLRYACYSAKYRVQASNEVVGLLCQLQKKQGTTLVLDNRSPVPDDLKCMVMPIVQMHKFKEIVFRNYAPFGVCRIIHYFLKYGRDVTSIVLDGYGTVVPRQLRFDRIDPQGKEALSLALVNCRLSVEQCSELMSETGKYKGEVQKIVLGGMDMNDDSVKEIFREVKKARGFRTLEVFVIDGIDSMRLSRDQMSKRLSSFLRHCRFLRRVSLGRWSTPMGFDLNMFGNNNVLGELCLSGQNMSSLAPRFSLGANLYLLDMSQALFSGKTLLGLLDNVSQFVNPISLLLRHIILPPNDWGFFYDELAKLRRCTKLKELDWSYNEIPEDAIDVFGRYFLADGQVRLIGLDGCFGVNEVEQLRKLLSYGQSSLWGLSLRGSTEKNFSENISQVCEILAPIEGLRFLDLSGQNMSDADGEQLLSFLGGKAISEVYCDETHFSDPSFLFNFYQRLCGSSVRAVGRPVQDMIRFFEGSFSAQLGTTAYDVFANDLKGKLDYTGVSARSYYLCQENPTDSLDMDMFYNCVTKFPTRYYEDGVDDRFDLLHETERLGSLCLYHTSGDTQHLFQMQNKMLHTATEPPIYRQRGTDADEDLGGGAGDAVWKESSIGGITRVQVAEDSTKPPPPPVLLPDSSASGLTMPQFIPPQLTPSPPNPILGHTPPVAPSLPSDSFTIPQLTPTPPANPIPPAPEISPPPSNPVPAAPEIVSPPPANPVPAAPEIVAPPPANPVPAAPEVVSPPPANPVAPAPEISPPANPVGVAPQILPPPANPLGAAPQILPPPASPLGLPQLPTQSTNDPLGLPPMFLPPAGGFAPVLPPLGGFGLPGADSSLPMFTVPPTSSVATPNLMQFQLGGVNTSTLPQFGDTGLTPADLDNSGRDRRVTGDSVSRESNASSTSYDEESDVTFQPIVPQFTNLGQNGG